MADAARYAKTEKGAEEISKRRKNLDRRMRTMLILVDPAKSAAELATQAVQLGVPRDFLQIMVRDGFIRAVAGGPSGADVGATATPVSVDELARLRQTPALLTATH